MVFNFKYYLIENKLTFTPIEIDQFNANVKYGLQYS